jgi:glutaredoxin
MSAAATVQVLLNDRCESCQSAIDIWSEACRAHRINCQVLDLDSKEGRQLAEKMQLATFPAIVIDGRLRAIGVSSRAEAERLLSE